MSDNDNQDNNQQNQGSKQAIYIALISSITAILIAFINILPDIFNKISDHPEVETSKFDKLEQLLREKDFRGANRETGLLMPHYPSARPSRPSNWILSETQTSVYLPCNELIEISRLWEKYSNNKFGFGVQRQIWLNVGGTVGNSNYNTYELFAEKVGWKSGKNWLDYNDFTFDTGAPYGHLPTDLTATRKNDRIYSAIYQAQCPL